MPRIAVPVHTELFVIRLNDSFYICNQQCLGIQTNFSQLNSKRPLFFGWPSLLNALVCEPAGRKRLALALPRKNNKPKLQSDHFKSLGFTTLPSIRKPHRIPMNQLPNTKSTAHRTSFQRLNFNHTAKAATSAGLTPWILVACPIVLGLIRVSFCRASALKLGTL